MKIYVGYYWWGGGTVSAGNLTIGMICTDRSKVEQFIRDVDEKRSIPPFINKKREWHIEELDDGEPWPDF